MPDDLTREEFDKHLTLLKRPYGEDDSALVGTNKNGPLGEDVWRTFPAGRLSDFWPPLP